MLILGFGPSLRSIRYQVGLKCVHTESVACNLKWWFFAHFADYLITRYLWRGPIFTRFYGSSTCATDICSKFARTKERLVISDKIGSALGLKGGTSYKGYRSVSQRGRWGWVCGQTLCIDAASQKWWSRQTKFGSFTPSKRLFSSVLQWDSAPTSVQTSQNSRCHAAQPIFVIFCEILDLHLIYSLRRYYSQKPCCNCNDLTCTVDHFLWAHNRWFSRLTTHTNLS